MVYMPNCTLAPFPSGYVSMFLSLYSFISFLLLFSFGYECFGCFVQFRTCPRYTFQDHELRNCINMIEASRITFSVSQFLFIIPVTQQIFPQLAHVCLIPVVFFLYPTIRPLNQIVAFYFETFLLEIRFGYCLTNSSFLYFRALEIFS